MPVTAAVFAVDPQRMREWLQTTGKAILRCFPYPDKLREGLIRSVGMLNLFTQAN